jgi:hypothetical protein
MSKVRLAIVGVGNCASSLVQGLEYYKDANPDDRVMPDPILVGRNAEKVAALAREHGIERSTADLDAALKNPDDTVFFDAATTQMRADLLTRAIEAGKHIYCEKPVADDLNKAIAVAMLAKAKLRNIAWPQLSAQDLSDLLVYLRNLPSTRGHATLFATSAGINGEAIFKSKGCVACHQSGSSLASRIKGRTLTEIAAAMWNHAPRMPTQPAGRRRSGS